MAQTKRRKRRRRQRDRQDQATPTPSPEPPTRKPDLTPIPKAATWWATAAMLGLPAVTAAAVFANILPNTFVYDDKWTLDRLPSYADTPLWFFFKSGRGFTYLVHTLDRWIWGTWAPGFHLTNIILHSLASSLASYAAFVLVRSTRAALLCGLLFAVHPVHVEAVAVFSYRKDILAMIFVLLALVCWLRTQRQILYYLATILCLGLGLLSKEVAAVGLVPVLFLADLLPGHRHPAHWTPRLRRAIWRILPFVVIGISATTALAGNIFAYFTQASIHEVMGGQFRTYGQVLVAAAASVPDVLRLLFVPITLCADYPPHRYMSMEDQYAMVGAVVIIFWIMGTLLLARRAPMAAFGMAWTLIMCLPCSNILPLTQFFVAERYLYVPSFGVCLLLTIALQQGVVTASKAGRVWLRRVIVVLSILLVTAGATRSLLRCNDWYDDRSLWSSAVRDGLGTARAHFNLGNALKREGSLEEAVLAYREASRCDPAHTKARVNLAITLHEQRHYHEAVEAYRMAWVIASLNGRTRQAAEIKATMDRLARTLSRGRKTSTTQTPTDLSRLEDSRNRSR